MKKIPTSGHDVGRNSEAVSSTLITRRRLLGAVGLGILGAPRIIAAAALGRRTPPSDRIVVGSIGLGIRGTKNTQRIMTLENTQVVAVCDVSGRQREKAKALVDTHYGNKDCSVYDDFRDLIARADIDAVIIAAPDHWHVLMGLAAARARKDMYFEKPIGLSLKAAQALRRAVRKHKNVFQFGTQQRSSPQFRLACELVRQGRIGKLHTIHVGAPASRPVPSQLTAPVPEDLDYNMWLGPAPWAPYNFERCRPYSKERGYSSWYHISDYCLGFIGNWGIHHLDIAQWGNGSDGTTPIKVSGTGAFPKAGLGNCCTKWELTFNYANGVTMHYTDNQGKSKQGVRFEGTEGWVYVNRQIIQANPKALLKGSPGAAAARQPFGAEHYQNFIQCVRSRKQTTCPIDIAVRSDTICHLANIATRLRRPLRWDPDGERFLHDDEANRMLSRPMRAPWTLEA